MGLLSIIIETKYNKQVYCTSLLTDALLYCFLCYEDGVFAEELVSDNICACIVKYSRVVLIVYSVFN